jgi:hypothetical protein
MDVFCNLLYYVESAWFGWETAESDATIGDVDNNSRPDLIVAWIDNPVGENKMYYLIEWESRVGLMHKYLIYFKHYIFKI